MSAEDTVLDLCQVAIFGRQDSPIKDKISELEIAMATDPKRRGTKFSADFVDLDEAFSIEAEDIQQQLEKAGEGNASAALLEQLAKHKDAYTVFLQKLQHAQLAIIDLSFAELSYYVLSIRQLMTDAPTIALAENNSRPTFANARFITDQTLGQRWSYIDTSKNGWLTQALDQARAINNPKVESWKSDIRSVGLFNVAPLEPAFKDAQGRSFGKHVKTWRALSPVEPKSRPVGPIIEIWKGDITKAKDYSVWVNSENTFMEMARFWDKSVSARIRTLGSINIGLKGDERKDALGLELAERMGTKVKVDIGTVFITPTHPESSLYNQKNGNRVKYVAHVAAVQPRPNHQGFESGGEVGKCVRNVFAELADYRRREIDKSNMWLSVLARATGVSNKQRRDRKDFNSVLFPLLGSGDGGAHVSMVAHQMVSTICELIRADSTISNDKDRIICGSIKRIGLIAYQPSHLAFLERELRNSNFIEVSSAEHHTNGETG